MGDVDTSFSLFMIDRARKHKFTEIEFEYSFIPGEGMLECDYTYYPDPEDLKEVYEVVGSKCDIAGESLHKFLLSLHDDDEHEAAEALWGILDSLTYSSEYQTLEAMFKPKAELEFIECFEQQVPDDHKDDYLERETFDI